MIQTRKIPSKAKLIIALSILAIIILVVPFELLLGRPSVIGALISKVYVRGAETPHTCNITLEEGWNLVGFACKPSNTSVESMLQGVNFDSIHTFVPTETLDYWKSYNPSLPAWVVQDIYTIDDIRGYWIKLDDNTSLLIQGNITIPAKIDLVSGWNLIGYPAMDQKSVGVALATIESKFSVVWAYNTTDDTYLYYNPLLGSNTLDTIFPEKGYWINMTQGGIIWIT